VQTAVNGRYGKETELHQGDGEVQLGAGNPGHAECPVLFWRERDANFVIIKAGEGRYRCQFFYTPSEQLSTGVEEFTDIAECVVTLLQVQADNERTPGGMFTGKLEKQKNW